jgi:NADPH:quinone reductase-like Zn-dependent oxidoreductase
MARAPLPPWAIRVKGLKSGDRVYAFGLLNPKGGFYADYAAVKADDVSRIPGKLTTQQAGAMPVDAMTALRGLDDTLGLKPAESVMIFGASGGIGHLAVQLAKRMGARVFAVASGSDGAALVKKLGADAVVGGHKDDIAAAARQFAPDGLDVALITAGGPAADKALTAMRAGGRVAYPNGVEPGPKPPFGIDARSYDGMPTRRQSRNSKAAQGGGITLRGESCGAIYHVVPGSRWTRRDCNAVGAGGGKFIAEISYELLPAHSK